MEGSRGDPALSMDTNLFTSHILSKDSHPVALRSWVAIVQAAAVLIRGNIALEVLTRGDEVQSQGKCYLPSVQIRQEGKFPILLNGTKPREGRNEPDFQLQ
jgi:hypothetical protein